MTHAQFRNYYRYVRQHYPDWTTESTYDEFIWFMSDLVLDGKGNYVKQRRYVHLWWEHAERQLRVKTHWSNDVWMYNSAQGGDAKPDLTGFEALLKFEQWIGRPLHEEMDIEFLLEAA